MENTPATKKDLANIEAKIDDLAAVVKEGFDGVKKEISGLKKDIRYIHQDLIKHDERTETLIKLVKGEPLKEVEAQS